MHPVTVAVTGGLGNQLFQFAAARAVAKASGRDVRLCYRMFDRPWVRRAFVAARHWVRELGADQDARFRLAAMARTPELLAIQSEARETTRAEDRALGFRRGTLKRAFKDPSWGHEAVHVLRTVDDARDAIGSGADAAPGRTILVAGYMAGDAMVAPQIQELRAVLRIAPDTAYLRQWTAWVREAPTVGVHVRRGDYAKPAYDGIFPILPAEWYRRAAERVHARHPGVRFVVVTDEPAWTKANLRLPGEMRIASAEHPASAREDLALLAACAHHVIANSTFSWWGARLAGGGGTVVAPSCWMLTQAEPAPAAGFMPESWLVEENPRTRS